MVLELFQSAAPKVFGLFHENAIMNTKQFILKQKFFLLQQNSQITDRGAK